MRNKLDGLLQRAKITIISNHTYQHGRFTVVELEDSKGHKVVGLSRCSVEDELNLDRGVAIARGRAECALYKKLRGIKTQHVYMG